MQRESLKYYTRRDKRAGREGKKGEDREREKMRPPPLRAKEEWIMYCIVTLNMTYLHKSSVTKTRSLHSKFESVKFTFTV